MNQPPLFPMPPVVAAVITVNVTQAHIDQAYADDTHPVSLAVLDAMPGTEDADVIALGAYVWTGHEMQLLRFDHDGIAFVRACDGHEAVSPLSFTAEVIKP